MNTTLLTHCALAALLASLTVPVLGQTHTHGSMVGSLEPTSVVVWTRASSAAFVSVLVNTSPTTTGAAETAARLVIANDDFTAHIRITGLRANSRYYYATRVANPTTPTNNTTTSPSGHTLLSATGNPTTSNHASANTTSWDRARPEPTISTTPYWNTTPRSA